MATDGPALTSATVPEALVPLFLQAQRTVEAYFDGIRRDPTRGTIEVGEDRYVLVRSSALAVEFHDIVRGRFPADRQPEASALAHSLLFDLAHAAGLSDARAFATRMGLEDPVARLSAGPVHFAHAGWAFVELLEDCAPVPGADFLLVYDHPYSFESTAWCSSKRTPDRPCCSMNAGYSSGWCQASFDTKLVAAELTCQALGHDHCRFIMAPPERLPERIAAYLRAHPELGVQADEVHIPDPFAETLRSSDLAQLAEALTQRNAALEARVLARTTELTELAARLEQELAERRREEARRLAMESRLLEAQRLESLGLLAGGVAHDFNNLLATILGSVELLRMRLAKGKPAEELLDRLEQAADQASGLTRQLLSVAGRSPGRNEPVDLEVLLEELLVLLRASVSKNASLVLSVEPGVRCAGDPTQLRQVFMNLVLNGVDALRGRRGTIEVLLYRDTVSEEELGGLRIAGETGPGDYAVVEVRDNGIGMDHATAARVFDPFYSTKGTGRGLGLAAVRGILAAHGASMHLESTLGEGTVFSVFLPLTTEEVAPPSEEVVERRFSGTVLLVDDEPQVRATLRGLLESVGLTVREARDGRGALRSLQRRLPELVVLDRTMPGLTGLQTLARLRAQHPSLPVVLASGFDAESAELSDDSATMTLAKPFSRRELVEVLESLLGRPPG